LALRYFIFIFSLERACWGGKPSVKAIAAVPDVFREGDKPFTIDADFIREDGNYRPIFLYLVAAIFCHYNKPVFELNFKTGC
jgi:hypothetical protein